MKYTLADGMGKKMTRKEIEQFLSQPNLLRLAVIDERDGRPVVHPVWYLYEKEKFYVATGRGGVKARSIDKNMNVYFTVDIDGRPPRGVRGKAVARVIDDPDYATEVTKKCVMKYLGGRLQSKSAKMILAAGPSSVVLEITPRYIASWKY